MVILNDIVHNKFYSTNQIVSVRKYKNSQNTFCINIRFTNNEYIDNPYANESTANTKLIEIRDAIKNNSNIIIDI